MVEKSVLIAKYLRNTDFFPCLTYCSNCGYVKYHTKQNSDSDFDNDKGIPGDHFSCICILLESSAICCIEGYANLLASIPAIATCSPIPMCTIQDHILGLEEGAICISREEHKKMRNACIDININALIKFPNLKTKYIPILFKS